MIGRERLTRSGLSALAEAAGRDVAEFDQQGCVAPQRWFVELGGEVSPREFAAALADVLARRAEEWPRIPLPPTAAAAIHQQRAAAEVRAAVDPVADLFASNDGTAWTVILDPQPSFGPGCLYRTVTVHPVTDLSEVCEVIAPYAAYLQTAAAAIGADRLKRLAVELACVGVTRICPIGHTQRPAAGWRPDGRARLSEFVRWVDWEQEV
jgi:hypothetical protein